MEKLRKGDLVKVITGEHTGKQGRVLEVLREEDRVIVESVNVRWKHLRRTQQNPQGGRVEKESPIHQSNVMVVSEETGKAQRVKIVSFQAEDAGRGRRLRYRVGAKDGKPGSARDKELADKHAAVKG